MVSMGRYLGQVAVVDKAGNVSNVQGDPDARTKMYAYNLELHSSDFAVAGTWVDYGPRDVFINGGRQDSTVARLDVLEVGRNGWVVHFEDYACRLDRNVRYNILEYLDVWKPYPQTFYNNLTAYVEGNLYQGSYRNTCSGTGYYSCNHLFTIDKKLCVTTEMGRKYCIGCYRSRQLLFIFLSGDC